MDRRERTNFHGLGAKNPRTRSVWSAATRVAALKRRSRAAARGSWRYRTPKRGPGSLTAKNFESPIDFASPRSTSLQKEMKTMRTTKTTNALLWTIQVLLAALFLFAGAMKLFIIPAEALAAQSE